LQKCDCVKWIIVGLPQGQDESKGQQVEIVTFRGSDSITRSPDGQNKPRGRGQKSEQGEGQR